MNLTNEPGWSGAFTREQAEGAYPNGSRVLKTFSQPGDAREAGAVGIVLGSVAAPAHMREELLDMLDEESRKVAEEKGPIFFYFIEWLDQPMTAVGCVSFKVERIGT